MYIFLAASTPQRAPAMDMILSQITTALVIRIQSIIN